MYESNTKRNTQATISPDQFNIKTWNAWHYGDDAIITDAVKQTRRANFVDNKHTRYYKKQNDKMRAQEAAHERQEKLQEEEFVRQEDIVAKMRFRSDFRKEQMKHDTAKGDGACVVS